MNINTHTMVQTVYLLTQSLNHGMLLISVTTRQEVIKYFPVTIDRYSTSWVIILIYLYLSLFIENLFRWSIFLSSSKWYFLFLWSLHILLQFILIIAKKNYISITIVQVYSKVLICYDIVFEVKTTLTTMGVLPDWWNPETLVHDTVILQYLDNEFFFIIRRPWLFPESDFLVLLERYYCYSLQIYIYIYYEYKRKIQ